MNLLDLYEQREPYQQAIDKLEQRRISDLEEKLDYLKKAYSQANSDEIRSAIKKRYNDIMAERDSYYSIKEADQPSQRPPAKGLLKGKDLVTPQQRVAGATPPKPGLGGAVKDVVGGLKRWIKGEPDQGPTYEDKNKKKSSDKDGEVQNLAVQRYLTKVRREYPAAYSDLEAISSHEIEKEKQTQTTLTRMQRAQASAAQQLSQATQVNQAQSQLIKDLENQVSDLSGTVKNVGGADTTTEPIPTTAPGTDTATKFTPATAEPDATPDEKPADDVGQDPLSIPAQSPEEIPSEPKIDTAQLPKKDKKILPRVRRIQRSLEKRVDQYQTVRALKDTEKMEKMQKDIEDLQSKLDAETARLSDQGQDVVQQSGNVIDITSRLKGAGLEMPRTGTYGESVNEQDSPVIGSMVQQIEKQTALKSTPEEMYNRNMKAFTDAYGKTRGVNLYYGGSARMSLPFSDMDALVTTITAFPPSQKSEIWKKLFTDPNYLKSFLEQYVEQAGLIEGDVIPLAQQRQAPAQLKAYNLALEIMRAARNPKISTDKIDIMKQNLFKDFGTRIQKHPEGYYYIVFQGKPIKLPDPNSSALEEHGGGIGPSQRWQDLMPEQDMAEGWSDAYVSRRTGRPRTPYSVYIKGKKWKDFANDDHARAVMDKLKAKFKADGRDPETVTIAPTDMSEDVVEGIRDTASATAVIACLLAGGGLTGCATAPQKTTAQQVLKTGQDIGGTVIAAKRITRAGAEEEVRQELRNLARGMGGQSAELNHSNILKIWRKIKGPDNSQAQNESKEVTNKQEYFNAIDSIDRQLKVETNPANKQILRKQRELLQQRARAQGWVKSPINEIKDTEAVEQAIIKRIMVAHRDMLVKYGPEKIMTAAEDVAYNVGDIGEIGTSDVSGWVNQVQYILGAKP